MRLFGTSHGVNGIPVPARIFWWSMSSRPVKRELFRIHETCGFALVLGGNAERIEAAKDQVRKTCGVEPNRMVISSAGFRALKSHATIIDRFKYTTSESITAKMLAGLFDLDEVAVGKAVYLDDIGETPAFKAWGNVAVLAYTPMQDAAMEQPSFGYTYTFKGHPFVKPPRWEGGKRSWICGVTYERKPVLTGIASGFLFSNIVGHDHDRDNRQIRSYRSLPHWHLPAHGGHGPGHHRGEPSADRRNLWQGACTGPCRDRPPGD